jgi:hypothetical protein
VFSSLWGFLVLQIIFQVYGVFSVCFWFVVAVYVLLEASSTDIVPVGLNHVILRHRVVVVVVV